MDELIILDTFTIAAEDDTVSFGVIVTSRRIFRNIGIAVRDQGAELQGATDGTYKLHAGGWTIVDFGSEAVVWDRQTFAHRFMAWAYMFVRSETTEAYARMFRVVRARAQEFLGVDLVLAFASLDHSEAIASAFRREWPRVRLLTCWSHLVRQARKKRSLLSDNERFDDIVLPHLRLLRAARTHAQFIKMSVIITNRWVEIGEPDYANWFREVYLADRWSRWHINGAGVAGVIPYQQGIEAHHAVIKRTCAPSTRASTGGVMNGILPRILQQDGETLCPASAAHLCASPVPPEMLLKAQRLVSNTRNFRRVFKGRGRRKRLVSIVFNSTRHLVDGFNPLSAPVDADRARRFTLSLEGHVSEELTAQEVEFELLSLHRVSVGRQVRADRFGLAPEWSTVDIASIRRFLQCTCETRVRSGWVCSHVLAPLSLHGLLDLQAALTHVPIRRTPGRPPQRRRALVMEENDEGYFGLAHLTQLFIRRPGQPLQWSIVDDFEVTTDGDTESTSFIGVVAGVRLSDGVYVWSARFDQGDMRDYEAEDLAHAVRRARALGVQVTA